MNVDVWDFSQLLVDRGKVVDRILSYSLDLLEQI